MPAKIVHSNKDQTRERILRAAEALFIEHGFEGSSLRRLTTAAQVNLGAVNYHFGSKDALFEAMLAQWLDPMHAARLAMLDEYQHAAGDKALACEQILNALFAPALQLARQHGEIDFLRLLGRAYIDPSPLLHRFLSDRYAPNIERFSNAFARALPQLPREELSWRLHFLMGTLAYTLAGADAWKLLSAIGLSADARTASEAVRQDECLVRRLAPFLIAGLQAPAPDLQVSPKHEARPKTHAA